MKNALKLIGLIVLAAVIGFSMAACDTTVTQPDGNTWIDPATQTTQLTGGTVLSSYSGGNRALAGSQYGYETWDYSNGGTSTNKFTWYGANQGGGGAFKAEWTGYFRSRFGVRHPNLVVYQVN